MLIVESDILNFRAAIARARRRAIAQGVPVEIRRTDGQFPGLDDIWEILWENNHQCDLVEHKRLFEERRAQLQEERDTEATSELVQRMDLHNKYLTGRISSPGGTQYTDPAFAIDYFPDDE